MGNSYAVRNISKCTKDCLCLYVCPTGAADTENSIIDVEKCVGCGACANACPSRAISMVPKKVPVQQKHDEKVIESMKVLSNNKIKCEYACIGENKKLYKAILLSNRIMAEDIIRESGYMLPQSLNTKKLLEELLTKDLPEEIKNNIEKLLNLIPCNE